MYKINDVILESKACQSCISALVYTLNLCLNTILHLNEPKKIHLVIEH